MKVLDDAARLIGWMMIAVLVAVTSARADAPFSFADTPGKLPKTVVPIHYAIDLRPDLDKLTIAGSEVVEIDVKAPTDRLILNAVRMTFSSAALDGVGNAQVSFDADEKTARLTFPREIAVGRHKLRIAFTARINQRPGGPFRVEYGNGKRIFSTHLQPNEARQVFPCWDEPTFKATFELTATVPRTFLAVSNMPVASEQPVAGALKRVSFQRTPVMPTYIFALVAGELERTTLEAEGITIGVVAAPGKRAATRFALENAAALLKLYSDYTGFKYPLPKLDLVAIPGRAGEAHENWGAITFNERSLLVDAGTSLGTRRGIYRLIAHEMAHQWFGNLVTMAWWDNVWLNEGFAVWMETKTAERLHTDWRNWLAAAATKQRAMAADAGPSAYPVHRPVNIDREMHSMFDVMTYSKGGAVVRMLESFLGEEVFRDGIRRYMAKHAYSNATPADLWRALEEASGKQVGVLASAYIEQAGIPLVIVEGACIDGRQRMTLTQDRFTIRNPEAKPQHWRVPIVFGPAAGHSRREPAVLDGRAELAAGACGEAVKLNLGNAGYYRAEYDAATHAILAKAIATMTPVDRINLLADTWALIEAGRKPPGAYGELVDNLPADDDPSVWEDVVRNVVRLDGLSQDRAGRTAFQAYARSKLQPVLSRLGWEPAAGEPAERTALRALLIRTLGDIGDDTVLAEAKRRFASFLNDPASLATELRHPVIHLAGRTADRATRDTLLALAWKATESEDRNRFYSAAAGTLDRALAEETLTIALKRELPSDAMVALIDGVAEEHRDLAWRFVRANFSTLAAKQGPSFRSSYLSKLMSGFADRARAAELASFAPAHETSSGRAAAARAQEQILANADLAAQALPALDDWLALHQERR